MILTKREREVAQLLIWDNAYISKKLNIRVSTVRNIVHSIFEKTGAESRTQALVFLLQKGELNLYKIDTKIVDIGFWDKYGRYEEKFSTLEDEEDWVY